METYSNNPQNLFSVLIVDDSDEDRFTVRRLLQRSNADHAFEIREADTGARGLARCRESLPDCLLLDHNLGDTDGIALLAELNAGRDSDDPICPAVMLTSAGTEARVAARALKGGAQDYVIKETLTADGISLAIENAVEKVRLRRRAKQAELQFRSSLDNMPDCFGIYVAVREPESDRIVDFRCEYVNDAACRNNQMRPDEQVGQLLCHLLPSHRVNGLFDEYTHVVETGQPLEKISFLLGDTNFGGKSEYRERALDIRAWKMGDGFAAVWRDVTDRERAEEWRRTAEDAEQQLAAAAQTLAYHVENTPLANVEWDGAFQVKAWSKQAESVFGWTATEVLGKRPGRLPDRASRRGRPNGGCDAGSLER
jgi:CheY-like chemotaxis protein